MDICPDCGQECEYIDQHYVSSDCSDGSAKKYYECENCGDIFEDYPSRRETRGTTRLLLFKRL
jgi:hypothetical protein